MHERTLFGADWGSTNLRVFRFDDAGTVLEQRDAPFGISTIQNGRFENALTMLMDDWLSEAGADCTILLCGMVGSRAGWLEAPYLACPASLTDLAGRLVSVLGTVAEVYIVPGLMTATADGVRDVMRGEETQILGAVGGGEHLVIAPGTHSKWAVVKAERICTFQTFMTGELFALLSHHSVLGRLMVPGDHNEEVFELGCRRGMQRLDLTSLLFSVRTEGLFEAIAPGALSCYLSGLLIGTEVCSALRDPDTRARASRSGVTIIGSGVLLDRYRTALAFAGVTEVRTHDGTAACARGLAKVARAAKLGVPT